jgi:hypothetical protein
MSAEEPYRSASLAAIWPTMAAAPLDVDGHVVGSKSYTHSCQYGC